MERNLDVERFGIRARYPGRSVIRFHEGITRQSSKTGDFGRIRNLVGLESNGADDLRFGIWTMTPGEVHLLHHHPIATEVYFVLSGWGLFTVDSGVHKGVPGTCLYLSPGTRHKIVAGGDKPLEVICIWPTDRRAPDISGHGSYRSTVWDE
ncbi:MAG: cupin domain-containing protein [Chloroflexi bacterium]|nr:cupin domain-containing protein [Chloroflexota bacterium]